MEINFKGMTFTFSRGFVSSITLPRSALHHLPAILATQPIERITVDGVELEIRKADRPEWHVVARPDGPGGAWPTRSDLCEWIGEWIESVLPRHDGNINDADWADLVANARF